MIHENRDDGFLNCDVGVGEVGFVVPDRFSLSLFRYYRLRSKS